MRGIAKQATIALAGMLLGRMLGYAAETVMGRLLGPTGYGVVGQGISTMFVLGTVAAFGTSQGIARMVAFYMGKQDTARARGAVFDGLKLTSLLSFLVAIAVFALSPQIAQVIFKESNLIPILRLVALTVPFYVLLLYAVGVLQGLKRVGLVVCGQQVLRWGVVLVSFLAFYALGLDAMGGTWAHFVSYALVTCVLAWGIARSYPLNGRRPGSISVGRELIQFSWPLALSSIQANIKGNMDTLALGYLSESAQVGLYRAALMIAMMLPMGLEAVKLIFMPTISEIYARGEADRIRATFQTSTRWILYLTFPLVVVLVVFPDDVVTLLFGSEYALAATALRILAIGVWIRTMLGLAGQVTLAIGKTCVNFLEQSVALVSTTVLSFVLIPRLGIVGAAWATASCLVLQNLVTTGFVLRYLKILPLTWRHLGFIGVSLLVFVPLAAMHIWLGRSWGLIVVTPLLYVGALGLFGQVRGIDQEDRAVWQTLSSRLASFLPGRG
jgi:O-antigen/teichoic acid export membrane protein